MRKNFERQLNNLEKQLIKMGGLCEEAISLSARALGGDGAPDLQSQVHELESEINNLEREIEGSCMTLLLRQQPIAHDLRNVSAALRMISDLERIGDQAEDIAELVPHIAGSGLQSKVHINQMSMAAVKMVMDSVDAFVKGDLALARKVQADDDEVDRLFDCVKSELMELIEKKGIGAEEALDFLMAAKYLERIGDHAVNVAEWVEYSITGVHKSGEPVKQ